MRVGGRGERAPARAAREASRACAVASGRKTRDDDKKLHPLAAAHESAMASVDDDPSGLIPKAGQLLTTMAFCRENAEALHKCQQSTDGACQKESKAFEACATEAAPKVITTLVGIATKHCPDEVLAFQRCKAKLGPSAKCSREDLAAMWCASQVVMKTAAEDTAASDAPGVRRP